MVAAVLAHFSFACVCGLLSQLGVLKSCTLSRSLAYGALGAHTPVRFRHSIWMRNKNSKLTNIRCLHLNPCPQPRSFWSRQFFIGSLKLYHFLRDDSACSCLRCGDYICVTFIALYLGSNMLILVLLFYEICLLSKCLLIFFISLLIYAIFQYESMSPGRTIFWPVKGMRHSVYFQNQKKAFEFLRDGTFEYGGFDGAIHFS